MLIGKVAVTPRGAYNPATSYTKLDTLTYNGSSYMALQPVVGVTPSNDGVNYQLVAMKGTDGTNGSNGSDGTNGTNGAPGDDGTTLTTISSVSGVLTIDCSLGDNFITTLTENVTSIVLTNEPSTEKAKNISLEIEQHASAPKTVAFPAGWKWPGGTVGVVSSTNGAIDEANLVIRNKGGVKRYRAVLTKAFA